MFLLDTDRAIETQDNKIIIKYYEKQQFGFTSIPFWKEEGRTIINTEDSAIRKALKELGWNPPPEDPLETATRALLTPSKEEAD